jgi:hypothetical protein
MDNRTYRRVFEKWSMPIFPIRVAYANKCNRPPSCTIFVSVPCILCLNRSSIPKGTVLNRISPTNLSVNITTTTSEIYHIICVLMAAVFFIFAGLSSIYKSKLKERLIFLHKYSNVTGLMFVDMGFVSIYHGHTHHFLSIHGKLVFICFFACTSY